MTDWTDRRIWTLDCETNGTDPHGARIVTVAFGNARSNRPEDKVRTVVVAPDGFEIPEEAALIHGYTTERATAEGGTLDDALVQITQVLGQRRDDEVLVAYNSRFDISIVCREFARCGLSRPNLTSRIVDPFLLDRFLDRYRRGSRRLEAVCEHYGAILDGAHDAGRDAIAAARLAWVIGRKGEVKRRVRDADEGRELARLKREWETVRHDPDLLHALQVRLAAEQAAHLEEYLRAGDPKKGTPPDPEAVVEQEWPLIPMGERAAR